MAQRQQWDLAIRYFRTAHELVPTDPAPLLNLALANDKAGQREVVATAWYRAFLAAAPKADSAPQVQKRIVDLEIELELQYRKLLEAASQIADKVTSERESSDIWAHVAVAQVEAGELAQSQQSFARIKRPLVATVPLAQVVAAYAQAGHFEPAQTLLASIPSGRAHAWARAELAVEQAKRKAFAAARATADRIDQEEERGWAYSWIATFQARNGEIDAAAESHSRIPRDRFAAQAVALAYIGAALARNAGTWKGRSSAEIFTESAGLLAKISGAGERVEATGHHARARAEAGDTGAAEQLMAQLGAGAERYKLLRAIAVRRDDKQAAETYRWILLALTAEGLGTEGDISGLTAAAQSKSPAATGVAVARAAAARARFLQAFRQVM